MFKKFVLFSLLLIPFTCLSSCKAKILDDKIDSQEELEKAMLFIDIEYLQCDYLTNKQIRQQNEYSPSVFHKVMEQEQLDSNDVYSNEYYEYTPDGKCYLYECVDDQWIKKETSPK